MEIVKTNGNLNNKRILKQLIQQVLLEDDYIAGFAGDYDTSLFGYRSGGEDVPSELAVYYDIDCLPDNGCFILTIEIALDKSFYNVFHSMRVGEIPDIIGSQLEEVIPAALNAFDVTAVYSGAESILDPDYYGIIMTFDIEVPEY